MIQQLSSYIVPLFLLFIPLFALSRGVSIFERFVSGAAEGIGVVLRIFPYLLGMLVAIAVFRASGAFTALANLLAPLCSLFGIPADVLPLAVMRPLSGSGALAITAEIITTHGPDSFTGRLASVMQGSTDTTFYLLAVYFGSVGIKKYRYALTVGLSADLVSFIAAFTVCQLFFPA